MSGPVDVAPRIRALVDSGQMNHDAFAGLIAKALADAHVAAIGLREAVIPALPPSRRTFPDHLAQRLEDGRIFDESFVDDLNTLLGMLTVKVTAGTHIGWEADEHHICGGYEVVYTDEKTRALRHSATALAMARDAASAVLCAARAIRLVNELLNA
ncbi:hypothetical protein [Limimaricola cinnabarinus]|uniref:hypothetical protein n=1 Tax=Limimaricola cinnabarinus TaxID=1125964 RepID=UPI00249049CB|nr:hypothetical protein [Limimaricola cinnabarinus]